MEHPFGEWYLDEEAFCWIFNRLPNGSTIFELGSGKVTGHLARIYKMYSVEHDENFIGKRDTHYIHAPYKEYKLGALWYDAEKIRGKVPEYDLLIVDGPASSIRPYMLDHLDLFDLSKPILLDDLQEGPLLQMAETLAGKCAKRLQIFEGKKGKKFGVIDVC